jgi:hypothetical protein
MLRERSIKLDTQYYVCSVIECNINITNGLVQMAILRGGSRALKRPSLDSSRSEIASSPIPRSWYLSTCL